MAALHAEAGGAAPAAPTGGAPGAILGRWSVFTFTPFIDGLDFAALAALAAQTVPGLEMEPQQWQAAVGRRLLTPLEQQARESYFERKTEAALGRLARRTGTHRGLTG